MNINNQQKIQHLIDKSQQLQQKGIDKINKKQFQSAGLMFNLLGQVNYQISDILKETYNEKSV